MSREKMARSPNTAWLLLVTAVLVCFAAQSVEVAQLRKETAAAFDRYIEVSERRIGSELRDGTFLFIDRWPEKGRAEAYAKLREGQVLVNTKEEGHAIEVPHGLIHDWIGVLFIPNATLTQMLAVIQDYNNHQNNTFGNVGALLAFRPDGQAFQFCSGTLIAPTVFLTAAHCAHFFMDFLAPQGFTL